MLRFLKIFFVQLLKIVVVVLGIGLGLYFAFPVESWLHPQQNELPSQSLLLLFGIIGFLLGVALLFLIEYRGRLSARSFLGETLLMLAAIAFFLIVVYLGIILVAFGLSSTNPQENDPHGFVWIHLFLGGTILSIVSSVLLSALLTALWKFRGVKNGTSETIGQLS